MRAPVTSTGVGRTDSARSATGSISVKWKFEPTPSVLSTPISPPIISTSREVIARPSPVPSWRRVEDASTWLNFSKIAESLSARNADAGVLDGHDEPMPSSFGSPETSITTLP